MGLFADQDFEGLLNNLQDWELSFKDKDKKLKSQSLGKEKLVSDLNSHNFCYTPLSQMQKSTKPNKGRKSFIISSTTKF